MSTACTAAVNSRIDTFQTWYNTTKGILAGVVEPASATDQTMINQKMAEISATSACLVEKLQQTQGTSNSIQSTQEEILRLSDQLKQEEENIRIAQDRVKLLRFPNENASYYESWFPLGRPLQPVLVPIFFGLAIFLFTVTGLIVLSLMGIDVFVFLPRPSPYGGSSAGWGTWVATNLRWPFWVALAVVIGLAVYVRRSS
jgi:hypothetical protein